MWDDPRPSRGLPAESDAGSAQPEPHGQGRTRLDRAIDAAAFGLTRGDPSPHVRARLRASIASSVNGRRMPAWLPACAAAAAVLVIGFVVDLPVPAPAPPRAPVIDRTRLPIQLALLPAIASLDEPGPVPMATVRRVPRIDPPRPLAALEPLVVEPITVPQIAVRESAEVMPITIDPLRVDLLQLQ